jgi:peptidyl-prolyl cis-trans isomerase D
MISSMQRNKKWLLPTIWISTIAFVGAGFVGWGSYNPTAGSSSVAVVGKKEISMEDLNKEYTNIYSQYQQALGKKFNDEMAKQFNLQQVAYNNVVQRYLLLNLSDDFGFTVNAQEIYQELVNIPSFRKDGVFDNNTYKALLAQNRTTPNEFEKQIKKNLMVTKIQTVFQDSANQNTIQSLNKLFFSSDKVAINIIDSKNIKIDINNADIQKFYDENKQNYQSIQQYEVAVLKTPIKDDEKISKKEALKKYLKLKKETIKFEQTEIIDLNTEYLSLDEQTLIFDSPLNKVLKPMRVGDEFVIYKLLKKISPTALALADIKDTIIKDLKIQKTQEILSVKKDNIIKNFSGVDIGYISRDKLPTIDGLSEGEINNLVSKISTSTSIIDFINLENKIVVFKIVDTKLGSYDETKNKYITDTIVQLKQNQILSSLLEKLKNKYEINSNFKVN